MGIGIRALRAKAADFSSIDYPGTGRRNSVWYCGARLGWPRKYPRAEMHFWIFPSIEMPSVSRHVLLYFFFCTVVSLTHVHIYVNGQSEFSLKFLSFTFLEPFMLFGILAPSLAKPWISDTACLHRQLLPPFQISSLFGNTSSTPPKLVLLHKKISKQINQFHSTPWKSSSTPQKCGAPQEMLHQNMKQ